MVATSIKPRFPRTKVPWHPPMVSTQHSYNLTRLKRASRPAPLPNNLPSFMYSTKHAHPYFFPNFSLIPSSVNFGSPSPGQHHRQMHADPSSPPSDLSGVVRGVLSAQILSLGGWGKSPAGTWPEDWPFRHSLLSAPWTGFPYEGNTEADPARGRRRSGHVVQKIQQVIPLVPESGREIIRAVGFDMVMLDVVILIRIPGMSHQRIENVCESRVQPYIPWR